MDIGFVGTGSAVGGIAGGRWAYFLARSIEDVVTDASGLTCLETLAIGVAALLAHAFPAVGQLFVGLAFLTSFIFAMSVGGAAHARGATRLGDAHRRPR